MADGDEIIALLQPHVDSAEMLFNSLAPDREGRLSNDPDILGDELVALGFADPASRAEAHFRLAVGQG